MKRTGPVQPEGQRSDKASAAGMAVALSLSHPPGGLGGGGARGVHGMGFRGAEASGSPWTPRRDGGNQTMTPQTSRKRGGPLAAPARLPYVAQVRRLLDRFARDGSARWAWHNPEPPEPRLRHLVAEHLGIDTDELTANESLTEDLAADSLDLVELALAIEEEFSITLPEPMLTDVRTYGELANVIQTLDHQRCVVEATEMPAYVSARLMPAREHASGDRHHGGWLTPYTAQAIVEDALGAGRGARLEVT
ncbi:MAG: acyl carrier protein, partial [Deltaproteobacteria bacterium]